MFKNLLIALFFVLFSAFAHNAVNSQEYLVTNDISGLWSDQNNEIHVRIEQSSNSLIGSIVWLKQPVIDGKPAADKKNKSPELKSRELIGLTIFSNMQKVSENLWSADYYDIVMGGTTKVEIKLDKTKMTISTPAARMHYEQWIKIN